MLSFLSPFFLAGLVALGIPVLVHLVHRERKDAIVFPSLMFLEKIPYQAARRQKIRDWLLFALRCLAIILAVLAFSRPFLRRDVAVAAAATAGGRDVIIAIDRSFSMSYGDRWARAVAAAKKEIAGLGVRDRATILLFDDGVRAASEATSDHALLAAAIDSVKPSDGGTRYAPALALARRLLASSRLPRREVVMISDLQRSGWDLTDETTLPVGTTFRPIEIGDAEVQDVSVRAVETRRDRNAASERIGVSARVVNAGNKPVRAVAVRLEVNGREAETKRVDLAPNSGASVAFAAVPVPEGAARAVVRVTPDALPGDDAFHFVLARGATVPVLLIEHPDAPEERALFLSRALAIGDHPAFEVSVRRASQLSASDIAGKSVVIINDAGFPGGDAGRRLTSFVEAGGGLLVALGERSGAGSWPGESVTLLPAAPGAPVDRLGERGAVLGYLDRSHPALEVFGAAGSGDLTSARFFRYRVLAASSGVLGRFDDGAVALAERTVGEGRVLAWSSSFDGVWNDLPRQPVFLPFVHQLTRYAAAYRERRASYVVGEAVELEGDEGRNVTRSAESYVAVTPRSSRVRVGPNADSPALLVRESGFYEVRRAGAPGERPRLVATNIDPRELELASFDPSRISAALAPLGDFDGDTTSTVKTAEEREREQSAWWYLLAAGMVVLMAEGALAGRLSRATS